MRLAALVENKKSVEENLNELGFAPSIYSPDYKLLKREDVKYLHDKKIRVIPWTVNEPSDMLALKGINVDGFITDYPDRASKFKRTLNIQSIKGRNKIQGVRPLAFNGTASSSQAPIHYRFSTFPSFITNTTFSITSIF
ncbi:MAG: glycerophosphodiester phosphodiesterase family protein [Cytophagales bacterium]|nr:glycerophosphodiester phosphodiesterase family protein [Cytophagales bacterium]